MTRKEAERERERAQHILGSDVRVWVGGGGMVGSPEAGWHVRVEHDQRGLEAIMAVPEAQTEEDMKRVAQERGLEDWRDIAWQE